MFDLAVCDGTICDGEKGNDAVERDCGITGDRIAAIGRLAASSARLTLEAAGTPSPWDSSTSNAMRISPR